MCFLRKIIFHFPSKKKSHVFGKNEIPSFQTLQKRYIPVRFFWKDHILETFEENIIFP